MSAVQTESRETPRTYSERALKAIAGKSPEDQLGLLFEYVRQGEIDVMDAEELNVLRRLYIRTASALYRGRAA